MRHALVRLEKAEGAPHLPQSADVGRKSHLPQSADVGHESLLRWYDSNRRDLPWRRSTDPYRIWLSEIMLQQTRVAAVLEHYRAFLARFPTVRKLAAAPLESVLAAWSGLGYYRRNKSWGVMAAAFRGRCRNSAPCPALAAIPARPWPALPSACRSPSSTAMSSA
jgi:hypothetical protein